MVTWRLEVFEKSQSHVCRYATHVHIDLTIAGDWCYPGADRQGAARRGRQHEHDHTRHSVSRGYWHRPRPPAWVTIRLQGRLREAAHWGVCRSVLRAICLKDICLSEERSNATYASSKLCIWEHSIVLYSHVIYHRLTWPQATRVFYEMESSEFLKANSVAEYLKKVCPQWWYHKRTVWSMVL